MFTEQKITMYNKYISNEETRWHRQILTVTLRNSSSTTKNGNSVITDYNGLVRVYDTRDYVEEKDYNGNGWTCRSGDIIVNKEVSYDIQTEAPITELRQLYGDKNVYSISSYDDYRKGTNLDHIKIGMI